MPQANSLQWSEFRREGHESYARMALRNKVCEGHPITPANTPHNHNAIVARRPLR